MAITSYCTEADVQQLWSEFGSDVRADDDFDGDPDTGVIGKSIEQATTQVNAFLLTRYTVAVCAASTWVKWCTAVLAAVQLGKRRGNAVPEVMLEQANEYLETLKEIKAWREDLMADTGPAPPRYENGIVVSNMTVDGRFPRSKVRRVPSTSVGPADVGNAKRNDEFYPYGW